MRKESAELYKDKNLYVKNINGDAGEIELKQYFSQCGTISSVKIMRTDRGISKGFGFVCFSNPDEANRAINTLNGILFHQKPLYVAIAQTKRERTSYLRMMYAKQGPRFAPQFESQGSRLCWENLCLQVRAGTSSLSCGTGLKMPPTVGALPKIPRD
ncbi:hypothetical protein WN944_027713 [Citrus x changshan-huyou]|uniref:RRM domain-containing protein n=1 Tax=Citrus x changshan-huyou TaxID=2935761 RepID=A0AAP0LIF9_9ROSI